MKRRQSKINYAECNPKDKAKENKKGIIKNIRIEFILPHIFGVAEDYNREKT